ncbi:hypothetical protein FO519_008113 [Halicephalobus sp. NKZ332]|nr:hypothetical protein FO519_008113 [Halicephalobus sp. NKZ332]
MNSEGTVISSGSGGFYEPKSQVSIELPLLQTSDSNGNSAQSNSGFYQGYGYSNESVTPSTTSSTAYSSFFPNYNPYSAIAPQFELNMILNPWSLAGMDISSEVVPQLPGVVDSQNPLFAQTLSPLQPTHPAVAAMTRYNTRGPATINNRKGGRRPREDYESGDNDEDKEKRDKRRQRNKEAAARCRQRRLDLMSTLQKQKDDLETKNSRLNQFYATVRKTLEDLVSSVQNHSCPSSDQLHHQIEMASRLLRDHSHIQVPQSSGIHQLSQQHMPPVSIPRKRPGSTGVNENKHQPLVRPSTLQLGGLGSSKDDMLISPICTIDDFGDFTSAKRPKYIEDSPLERPSSLSLTNWGQTPSIITPSSGIPQIADLVKNMLPDEYNMLNQQTFLTPVVPSAISVTSSAPPPSNSDLQTL